jgi:hypothetical protein
MAEKSEFWPEHPLLPRPRWEVVEAAARRRGVTPAEIVEQARALAMKTVADEDRDPLTFGWEPPIWKVADALLDMPFCEGAFLKHVQERFGWDWATWKLRMRERLGFPHPIRFLCIMGGNRSGKSEYSAKRLSQLGHYLDDQRIYAFHMSGQRSVAEQQVLYHKYLPPEWRAQKIKSQDVYISYTKQNGFTNSSFINPKGNPFFFRNYTDERDTALQGIEPTGVGPDELAPVDWVEYMTIRLSNRNGIGILTFTPVRGLTPTVKLFCHQAQVARDIPAFMLPKDGGAADPARALGLSAWEYEELWRAVRDSVGGKKVIPRAVQCRPEDVCAWLEEGEEEVEGGGGRVEGGDGTTKHAEGTKGATERATVHRPFGFGKSMLEPEAGRVFERVPRVLRSVNPDYGVIHFVNDNPWGNPKDVMRKAQSQGRGTVRVLVYGLAEADFSPQFPKFSEKVHVLPDEAIPRVGTNYCLIDPASDRNFFMTWARATEDADYFYREWPGNYWIPDIGVPEPWAIPSGRKEGKNDGDRGRGAFSFGFGLLRYKFEMARLERWDDFLRWLHDCDFNGDEAERAAAVRSGALYPDNDDLREWDERSGGEEPIHARIIDSRAANAFRVERERPVTLLTELEDIGVSCELAPGEGVREGVKLIAGAMDYKGAEEREGEREIDHEGHEEHEEGNKKGGYLNAPRFRIARSMVNTIFAIQTWMNADPDNKSATKDPLDNVRYYYQKGCAVVSAGQYAPRGGFYYGRGGGRGVNTTGGGRRARRLPRPVRAGRRVIFEA